MLHALVALLALALAVPLADVLCFVWLRADLPDECEGAAAFWACLYWYLCGSEVEPYPHTGPWLPSSW
jgi:hypothetical protein